MGEQEAAMKTMCAVARLPTNMQGEQCMWGMLVCTLALQVENSSLGASVLALSVKDVAGGL